MEISRSQSRLYKGTSVLIAMFAMAGMTLTGAGTALASVQTSPTVNVGATISSGSGSDSSGAPTIECSWILTDNNPYGGQETQQYAYATSSDIGPYASGLKYTNYTQPAQGLGSSSASPNAPSYAGTPNAAQSFVYGPDNSPSSYVSTPNCTSTGAADSHPSQPTGSQKSPVATGIEVLPNLFDSATGSPSSSGTAPRRLEVWAAADNATAVTFNVFYPNGSEDTELGGVQVGPAQNACSSYGTSGSMLTNMFTYAGPAPTGTNQVSSTAIHNDNGTGIVDLCNDNEKSLWYQAFTLSKDDPNGTYTVEVIATNTAGNSYSWISFYVIPVFDLAIDFASVDFVSSNTYPPRYFVSGSSAWGTAGMPTVANGGNSGEQIGVDFGTLTCSSCTGSPGYINSFDADLGYNAGDTLTTDVPATAGTTAWITNNTGGMATGAQVVCPNDTPKLDLSMEPPISAIAGTYSGTMTVQAESDVVTGSGSGGCVTDNGAPYILTGSTGTWKSLMDSDPSPIVRA